MFSRPVVGLGYSLIPALPFSGIGRTEVAQDAADVTLITSVAVSFISI
jgi:hypothetical protein